ncbi:MAG: cation diffusion facilitator family transporter [Oleiphilaceae bacterium]|nr:cation diffusion facilitator family transporter [Oleiphilaceae bacterium]
MQTERGALGLSAAMAGLLGTVAVTFALASNSQAILLDGIFNLIYVMIALVTVRVSRLVTLPDNERYPYGYAYFEPLVNASRGLVILGVGLLALGDSLLSLFSGGREVSAGLAIVYAAFATLICTVTLMLLRRAHRLVPGPLLAADVENWLINSLISGAVLLSFLTVPVLHHFGWPTAARYVDPLLVTLVVALFCLAVPARMTLDAIKELLNRAPPRAVRAPVSRAVAEVLAQTPVVCHRIRMVRPGRTLYVMVYVVLPATGPLQSLPEQDRLREQLHLRLQSLTPHLVLDMVFTGEERWLKQSQTEL